MEVDDGTAALVLRLQLEDLASIHTPADGEGNSDNEAAIDQAYALQLYQQELSAQRTILNDHRIASDIQAGRRPCTATTETGLARPTDHNLARGVQQSANPPNAAVGAQPGQPGRPAEPAAELATGLETETAIDLAAEPIVETAAEPAVESAADSAAEPVDEPVDEPIPEAATDLTVESVAETTSEPTPEPATDLADDSVAEPASEASSELSFESTAESPASGGDVVDTTSVEDSNKSSRGLLASLETLYKLFTGSFLRPDNYSVENDDTTTTTSDNATMITVDEFPSAAGESSSAAGNDERPILLGCGACGSEYPYFDIARLPGCDHHYCRDCLDRLFRLSLTDETLFPPRCCRQPIPFEEVRVLLSGATARDFERQRPELETADRTYCHVPTCSTWIPPADITDGDRVGTCPNCAARTCATCKGEEHNWGRAECLGDEATQALLRAAGDNGWQRCYNCRRFVELNTGCYHITCRCRAEFCYLCGARWKTCTCRQMDEHRLFERAQVVVQRGGQNATRGDVEKVAQRLRRNHECTHQNWRFMRGEYQCEECQHTLPRYIFECEQCMLHACNRCRMNRF